MLKKKMRKLRSNCCKKRNTGFTLVEMVITVSIFAILLGIIVPSLNSVLGFRVQRATNSITAALDKTRREAMNRLVGEMKLEYRSDGYYITYYLDRGKESESSSKIRSADSEKIAPAGTRISYQDNNGNTYNLWDGTENNGRSSLILTYDRATGGFLPIQSNEWEQNEILEVLESGNDIPLDRDTSFPYCLSITVSGGMRTRVITLNIETGKYSVEAK